MFLIPKYLVTQTIKNIADNKLFDMKVVAVYLNGLYKGQGIPFAQTTPAFCAISIITNTKKERFLLYYRLSTNPLSLRLQPIKFAFFR